MKVADLEPLYEYALVGDSLYALGSPPLAHMRRGRYFIHYGRLTGYSPYPLSWERSFKQLTLSQLHHMIGLVMFYSTQTYFSFVPLNYIFEIDLLFFKKTRDTTRG